MNLLKIAKGDLFRVISRLFIKMIGLNSLDICLQQVHIVILSLAVNPCPGPCPDQYFFF